MSAFKTVVANLVVIYGTYGYIWHSLEDGLRVRVNP